MGIHGTTRNHQRPNYKPWDGDIRKLVPLGHGISGMVLAIDENWVAKIDLGSEKSIQDIETEREAYQLINEEENPYVLRCREVDNPYGLVLERCRDSVRGRLRSKYRNHSPPDDVVIRWAHQASQGLAYIHSCGIVQGDVGCHNMLLSADDTLKLADFAGSSIGGLPASVAYEVRSKLPGVTEPDKTSDIFALGSALYEIATGLPPYKAESWREIHGLYKRGKFPNTSHLGQLGKIIRRCWEWEHRYSSAQEVVYDLEEAYPQLDIRNSDFASEQSSELDASTVPASGREDAKKFKHTHKQSSHRRRHTRYHNSDSRWNERRGSRKEKQKTHHDGPVVKIFNNLFSRSSYTYTF